jgi:hypothetical protein
VAVQKVRDKEAAALDRSYGQLRCLYKNSWHNTPDISWETELLEVDEATPRFKDEYLLTDPPTYIQIPPLFHSMLRCSASGRYDCMETHPPFEDDFMKTLPEDIVCANHNCRIRKYDLRKLGVSIRTWSKRRCNKCYGYIARYTRERAADACERTKWELGF